MSNEIPTPRTDTEEAKAIGCYNYAGAVKILGKHARQLETELLAAQEEREKLRAAQEQSHGIFVRVLKFHEDHGLPFSSYFLNDIIRAKDAVSGHASAGTASEEQGSGVSASLSRDAEIFLRFVDGETPVLLASEYKRDIESTIGAIRRGARELRTNNTQPAGAPSAAPTQAPPSVRETASKIVDVFRGDGWDETKWTVEVESIITRFAGNLASINAQLREERNTWHCSALLYHSELRDLAVGNKVETQLAHPVEKLIQGLREDLEREKQGSDSLARQVDELRAEVERLREDKERLDELQRLFDQYGGSLLLRDWSHDGRRMVNHQFLVHKFKDRGGEDETLRAAIDASLKKETP